MTGPLQALAARYDRLATKGELPAYGFSWEKISYALTLGAGGRLFEVAPLFDDSGKKPRPREMLVPQSFKRPGTTPRSFFLWDKTSFALGVTRNKLSSNIFIETKQQHAAFVDLHLNLLNNTDDEGLRALIAFVRNWRPSHFAEQVFNPEMLDANIVFRLDGERGFLHDRPAAKAIWLAHLGSADAPEAVCLVSGERGPIARLHPSIKGVAGAQSSGASLVSFNLDAFTSYGNEQGANAPVSEAAAFGYGTALNALLARDSRNSIRIGDATVVFWAENDRAEKIVRGFFDPPGPDDESEAAALRPILEQMAHGRPIRQVVPEVEEDTRFFILGLAPNAARLSIRFWLETTFGELAEHFQHWWRDLRIEPEPWRGRPPSIWRLLYELAPQRKAENVPKHLAGELTRAVLTGGRLPYSLLALAIMRLRADQRLDQTAYGRRAAIIKSVLMRDLSREDQLVSLDRDNGDISYRLGRLFAVLERVQLAALGKVRATIRDRYYGAASATPGAIFPMILRNSRSHFANLRKGRGAARLRSPEAAGKWAEAEIEQIINGIDGKRGEYPRHFNLEQQGRFSIGYYHQRAYRKDEADQLAALEDDAPDTTDSSSED